MKFKSTDVRNTQNLSSFLWLFLEPPAITGWFLRNRVCLSVEIFSWNSNISFFLNFGTVLDSHINLCVAEQDFF